MSTAMSGTGSSTAEVFALPERLAAKRAPELIDADRVHLAAVGAALEHQRADAAARLAAALRAPGRSGQAALERDAEVHRLTARLRLLRRFGLDLCLGRTVPAAGRSGAAEPPLYIGRLGLTDADGQRLLVDWRTPAAAPFFAATHAAPAGLASRRRYRWTGARITDYWDEVFAADELAASPHRAALDDQSAFVASLGASRSPRMRDVLTTIQADQDAVIRAGSRGALVVDGGPGTGKTVVALHRAAYLLHADPRLRGQRDERQSGGGGGTGGGGGGGLLFVGPHQPYLDYVADVLPSLGEEGVRTCTVRDLLPEGATVAAEPDPAVARLKSSALMATSVIEAAVRLYQEPPKEGTAVETDWADLWIGADDWARAFDAVEPGTPHNEARTQIMDELLTVLTEERAPAADDLSPQQLRRALARDRELNRALLRAWPRLEPEDLVGDLWSVPAYLRRCAPWLSADEVRTLQRADPQAWTLSDLPLLDAARHLLGDPDAARREQRRRAAEDAERSRMADVITHLLEADDDGEGAVTMLRGQDLQDSLVDPDTLPSDRAEPLDGPFAHIVVDEAQELTDAEWQMLLRRCPSHSFTVVGDRAQARQGFTESWPERLARIGLADPTVARLSVNYRTPQEVMAAAEPVIRAVLPDANVPVSVRTDGAPVLRGRVADRDAVLADWLAAHPEGTACVINDASFEATSRVRSLTPALAKGLEFDLVVLVAPDTLAPGLPGAVDRYVAMTRATAQLALLEG